MKKNHLCLVAKADNGEVLGGIIFMRQEHNAFVISIAVKEHFQRNRIGSSLMQLVEEIVIFDVNRIEVISPKDERKRFYMFLGYKPYKENHMDKWLGFFRRSYCLVKKTFNFKTAPSGVPYES